MRVSAYYQKLLSCSPILELKQQSHSPWLWEATAMITERLVYGAFVYCLPLPFNIFLVFPMLLISLLLKSLCSNHLIWLLSLFPIIPPHLFTPSSLCSGFLVTINLIFCIHTPNLHFCTYYYLFIFIKMSKS